MVKCKFFVMISILVGLSLGYSKENKTGESSPMVVSDSLITLNISGDFYFNFPSDSAVPITSTPCKGNFSFNGESKIISEVPLRSKLDYTLNLSVTDISGESTYATINTAINSEQPGTPSTTIPMILQVVGSVLQSSTPTQEPAVENVSEQTVQ